MRENESRWVQVNSEELDKERSEVIRGVEVTVLASPYDVPDAVRGRYDEDQRRFIIEFRYFDEEEWWRDEKDKHLALRIGRNSGRLLGIEINVDALKANEVKLQLAIPRLVSKAIERLRDDPDRARKRDHYKIAGQVIAHQQNQLLDSLRYVS